MKKITLLAATLFAGLSFGQVRQITVHSLQPVEGFDTELFCTQMPATSASSIILGKVDGNVNWDPYKVNGDRFKDEDDNEITAPIAIEKTNDYSNISFETAESKKEYYFMFKYKYLKSSNNAKPVADSKNPLYLQYDETGKILKKEVDGKNVNDTKPEDKSADMFSFVSPEGVTISVFGYGDSEFITPSLGCTDDAKSNWIKAFFKVTLDTELTETETDFGQVIINEYTDTNGQGKYAATTINIKAKQNTALSNKTFKAENNFTFSPNPTRNSLTLKAKNTISRVELFNVLGQKALEANINSVNKTLDISSLNKGVYIMNVSINNTVGSYRIIKE